MSARVRHFSSALLHALKEERHFALSARQRARDLANTPVFASAKRERKKSRGAVCGAEESDRAASPAPTPDEVRSGAVLLRSGGPEPQATGAVPQPTDSPCGGSYHVAGVRRKNSAVAIVKTFQHSNATSPIWPGTTFTSSCAHGYPRTHVVPIGGLPFVLWGIFFRTVAGLHTTWLVNSVSHIWGSRRFETRNTSTNNWWVALLSFGDGWHNNHPRTRSRPDTGRSGMRSTSTGTPFGFSSSSDLRPISIKLSYQLVCTPTKVKLHPGGSREHLGEC
jgi:hypothetical protein